MAGNLREAATKAASRGELPNENFFGTKFFKITVALSIIVVVIIFVNFQNSSNNVQENSFSQVNKNVDQGKGGEVEPETLDTIDITYGQLNEIKTSEGGSIFIPSEALSVANAAAAAFLTGRWDGVPIKGGPPERLDVYSDFTLNQPTASFVEEGQVILVYKALLSTGTEKSFQIPLTKDGNQWFYIGYN